MDLAEVVSSNRSLLKREAPRFSAYCTHPFSYGRAFNFPHHPVGPLGINNLIAMSDINIHSAICNTDTDKDTDKDTDTEKDKDRDKVKDADTEMDTDLKVESEVEIFCKYSAIVPIAPNGLPETHHGTSSNSGINL
jgi:hypothetical protein